MAKSASDGSPRSAPRWTHVVADDGRDEQTGRPSLLQRRDDSATGSDGIDAARIGDEAGAAVDDIGQRGPHVHGEITREAERLVALAVLLQDREGELGERLAHEVVDAGFEHIGYRAQAVAVEALASPDADGHDPVVAAPGVIG